MKNKDITKVITPEKANDIGERLFLFPQSLNPMIDENEIREKIKELSAKYNVSVHKTACGYSNEAPCVGGHFIACQKLVKDYSQ